MKPYIKKLPQNSILKCNCVLWARTRNKKLPFNLWTYEQKLAIINANNPQVGAVAIIETKQKWGHVAVVIFVGKNHITIQEANFWTCQLTERHDTPASLRIAGYFDSKRA